MSSEGKQIFYEVAVATVLAPVESVLSVKKNHFSVYRENQRLKAQNIALKVENDRFREYQFQNQRLKNMLDFKEDAEYELISGEIISKNPGRFETSWMINLGSSDSVSQDMPVITTLGLVGKVAKVFPRHSIVQLLQDPNCKVSVLDQRSRVIGIVESFSMRKVAVRFPGYSDVMNGDTLVTSGLGGVFPKGIPVGVVDSDKLLRDDVVREVSVKLFQDPKLVEEFFVYKNESHWVVLNP